MALYFNCQLSIHNTELCHGCYAISIVYQSMLWLFMSYAKDVVRPDDLGTDISSLCFRACLSVLLVHPKGGRPGGAGVVTSYTDVVPEYAGSFGYDGAPRIDWGRPPVVTAPFGPPRSCFEVSVVPDVLVSCRSSCKDVTGLDVPQCGTFSPISLISRNLQL